METFQAEWNLFVFMFVGHTRSSRVKITNFDNTHHPTTRRLMVFVSENEWSSLENVENGQEIGQCFSNFGK